MIVSHSRGFIFVKTMKTAGTSVEILLSRHCGAGDVIAGIADEDEALRGEFGGRGPQNDRVPVSKYSVKDWTSRLRGQQVRLRSHGSARYIRRHVGRSTWNRLFKFTVVRNPFDRVVSQYWWRLSRKQTTEDINGYVASCTSRTLSNWWIYSIGGKVAVDDVIRYEQLDQDLARIMGRLGLDGSFELPRAKGGARKVRRHYSEELNLASRRKIEQAARHEMEAFGYNW